MNVPKEILKIWRKRIEWQDALKIQEKYKLTPKTVHRAKTLGICNQKTFDFINDYLATKINNTKQILEQITEK